MISSGAVALREFSSVIFSVLEKIRLYHAHNSNEWYPAFYIGQDLIFRKYTKYTSLESSGGIVHQKSMKFLLLSFVLTTKSC